MSAEPTTGRTSKYEARVKPSGEGFYAMLVRVDRDGSESVVSNYKARHFDTQAAGFTSVERYMRKNGL